MKSLTDGKTWPPPVEQIAATYPNFELVSVDCAEVPCLATFDLGDTDPAAAQEVVAVLGA